MHPWTKASTALGLATGILLFGGVAALATTISAGGSSGSASFGATLSTPASVEVTPPEITPPSVTGPKITPPSVTGPKITPPSVTGPKITPPSATAAPPSANVGDDAVTITVPLPQVTQPQVEGPQVTQPQVEGPQVTEPQVDEPQVTEPQVEGPQVTVNPTLTPIGASAQIQIG
jgi:hypothetical protein